MTFDRSPVVVYPPLPCRTSPPQAGRFAGSMLTAHSYRSSSSLPLLEAASGLHPISPLEREMSGRTEGGQWHPQFSTEIQA